MMSKSKKPKDICPECGQKWPSFSPTCQRESFEENPVDSGLGCEVNEEPPHDDTKKTDLKPTSEELPGFTDSDTDNKPFDFLVPSDTDESDPEWKWVKRYGEGWDYEELECRCIAAQSRFFTGKGTIVAKSPSKGVVGKKRDDDGGAVGLNEDTDGDEDGVEDSAVGEKSAAMVVKEMKKNK